MATNEKPADRPPARRMVSARELVGRTIVAFEPNAHTVHDGPTRRVMHAPTITLDDGSVLWCMTEEHPDAAEYGTFIGRSTPHMRKV